MQVSIETTSGLERRLTITVPSEEFEGQITDKLTEARGQVRLPGFRPGKVPLKEVRRRFGPGVRAEVAGELMQASFIDAVTQESLSPAGQPNLEVVKMDPGIDFEFTATFEVMPSVELANFADISVKRPNAEITDEDLANMIERLRDQRTTFEPVERAAQNDDQVKVDFEGRLDGEVFEGGTGTDVPFKVGAGQMIEDFDQAVLGLSAGEEKTFPATFPEDYQAENLKGKTVEFTLTVKEVAEQKVPELDEEFFKEFGVEDGSEESFRAEVKDNMQRELENAQRNQVKQQVLEELKRLHEVQLPHAMVHREVHVLKDQMLQQMQMYGGQGQKPPELNLPDEMFEDEAASRVKLGLIMNAVIENNDIEADENKVDARLDELAKPYGDPESIKRFYRSNEEQMRQIEMAVIEDQAIDLIVNAAAVEELESCYDDVIQGKAIPQPEPAEASDEDAEAETAVEADAAQDSAEAKD